MTSRTCNPAQCDGSLTYDHNARRGVRSPRHMTPISVRVRDDMRTQGWPVPNKGDITELLYKWRDEHRDAEDQLFALVLPDLRRLAHYLIKGERKGHSLQPTELVDQIYFRLVIAKNRDCTTGSAFSLLRAEPSPSPDRPWTRLAERGIGSYRGDGELHSWR